MSARWRVGDEQGNGGSTYVRDSRSVGAHNHENRRAGPGGLEAWWTRHPQYIHFLVVVCLSLFFFSRSISW